MYTPREYIHTRDLNSFWLTLYTHTHKPNVGRYNYTYNITASRAHFNCNVMLIIAQVSQINGKSWLSPTKIGQGGWNVNSTVMQTSIKSSRGQGSIHSWGKTVHHPDCWSYIQQISKFIIVFYLLKNNYFFTLLNTHNLLHVISPLKDY